MADFISSPPPKKQRIPVPTLDDLVSALVQYLPRAFDFEYYRCDMTREREFGLNRTIIYFYDKRRNDTKASIEIEIDGKSAQNGSARLWAEPFIVTGSFIPLSEPLELPTKDWATREQITKQRKLLGILIIPQADRSIAFRAARRWDRGHPIFED